ncbi:uncharacterized protein LOC135331333 isoform X2 [Halichondria panicea]|uniref:uncharacterized protein LOC135331333 isoform X2 n=1 Tax=Halichondria panicea TaxID=6063 RepID=UPI00312B5A41
MKIESLEGRVSALEDEQAAKPTGPEPILTCVQCLTEYKQSENAEGGCKHHTGTLKYGGWKATYTCCNASAGDQDKARTLLGCTKGKHRSQHHLDYPYSHYYFHMMDLSKGARELWLTMDVRDLVTDSCEWAEVGISAEGKVFVVVGSTRVQPVACAEWSMAELRQVKRMMVVDHVDPAGWSCKTELHTEAQIAKTITVSLKAASNKSALVKRLQLVLSGETFRPGSIETVSDPSSPATRRDNSMESETVKEGPVLDPGQDYSKGRKNDYPSVTNDDMFALELKQSAPVTVNSSNRTAIGKWNNLFTMGIRLSNGLPDSVVITQVYGEYLNKDGQWTRCEDLWIKPAEGERFLETVDLLVDAAAPLSMVFKLAIAIDGPEPDSWASRERAHHSLPQPLHFRVTCVDELGRRASLRLEQGNCPLSFPTYELRAKNWAKGKPLLFYLCADDVDSFTRSDVSIYYDDNGMMVYRPAPNDQGSTSFFLRESNLNMAAFQSQSSSVKEVELTELKKENKGSSVQAFALVDDGITCGIKVVIVTPTSKAEAVYMLPAEDWSTVTLTTGSSEVMVNSSFTVSWSLPRASKNDKIGLYPLYGKTDVSRATNRQAATQGECQIKVTYPHSSGRSLSHFGNRLIELKPRSTLTL